MVFQLSLYLTNDLFIDNEFENKKKDGTKLLNDIGWYKNEKFFTEERTELQWKIVSRDLIPNSTSKDYRSYEFMLRYNI